MKLNRVQLSSVLPGHQFFMEGYWYTVLSHLTDKYGDKVTECGILNENGITKFQKSSSDYVKVLSYS